MADQPRDPNLKAILGELFGAQPEVRQQLFFHRLERDAVVEVAGWRLLIETRVGINRASLMRYRERLAMDTDSDGSVNLLVVPHMPAGLATLCADWGIAWLDEVGNCDVRAPGLRLYVRGIKPDEPKPQRQPGLTSPKAQRFLRYLAFHNGPLLQREVARASDVDEGQASRIARQLVDEGIAARRPDGQLEIEHRDRLLDLLMGGVPLTQAAVQVVKVRPGSGTWMDVALQCRAYGLEHAVGATAAGSLLVRTVHPDRCRIWIGADNYPAALQELGLDPDESGSIELCFTQDRTLLEGRAVLDGVSIAHPALVYLDCLQESLTRAELAALRAVALKKPIDS